MPKNIVIFSDGTGQEGGENINSNIYKIFNMVEDRTDQQIAFYDSGVGSGWYEIFGKMFGFGLIALSLIISNQEIKSISLAFPVGQPPLEVSLVLFICSASSPTPDPN
jgi:Uncharacterized alpha/beta hydrolase domain (DUF2235)